MLSPLRGRSPRRSRSWRGAGKCFSFAKHLLQNQTGRVPCFRGPVRQTGKLTVNRGRESMPPRITFILQQVPSICYPGKYTQIGGNNGGRSVRFLADTKGRS